MDGYILRIQMFTILYTGVVNLGPAGSAHWSELSVHLHAMPRPYQIWLFWSTLSKRCWFDYLTCWNDRQNIRNTCVCASVSCAFHSYLILWPDPFFFFFFLSSHVAGEGYLIPETSIFIFLVDHHMLEVYLIIWPNTSGPHPFFCVSAHVAGVPNDVTHQFPAILSHRAKGAPNNVGGRWHFVASHFVRVPNYVTGDTHFGPFWVSCHAADGPDSPN